MRTEEFFAKLSSEIELGKDTRERISRRHNYLREQLTEILPIEDDFLTGSYPRHTMILPRPGGKGDVDFFVAFGDPEFGEIDLFGLMSFVRSALEVIKQDTPEIIGIKEQNRSIAVLYDDGFQIDVVPSLQIEKDRLYKIFDKSTQKAIKTNPKFHSKILTNTNEATASGSTRRLIPTIKILKFWRREKCDYFKSFHLELLTIKILESGEIRSFSEAVAKFFTDAGRYLQNSFKDPANDENQIDDYLDEKGIRANLLLLISKESETVNAAIEAEKAGNNEQAVAIWRRFFLLHNDKESDPEPIIIHNPPKQWSC